MEILTTAEVEGKILTLEQTFNLTEDKFITIKELFSIEGEVFMAITNHQIPYEFNLPRSGTTIQTGRFIFPARQFVLENNHWFN
jgi:hypothetical protein